jgi:signal transduction histidine kinase/DNA-binding NarL/FixJ family response regulator
LAGQKPKANVDQSLRWLIGIVIACLALVLGLKIVFADLQNELNERSVNERARLFVGEEIVRGIKGVEKDLYLMSVATNPAGYGRVYKSLSAQLDKLMHDLNVLKFGGTARREVQLNLEGREAMVREASYRPDAENQGPIMELIEIGPLLGQTRDHADELERLLALRWQALEKEDRKAFYEIEEEIATYLKFIPPQFERLDENANRLFFDSTERLRGIELELQKQRDRLRQVELSLVALVLVLSGLATALFVRRINQSNRKLEDALEAMRAARDEAERASRAKSEFVSRMSHELRTPLNAIIGFAELLEDEALAPEQHNYVKLINGSGKHLMELINQVLDHSKIEAGGLKLERIAFDFPAEIEAVMSIVTERATAKGLDFVASIADDLPRYVEGDPTRLRQILINLLANAVKFTERGSVELRVAREDGRIHFSVRDTGIGMDQAALARLFKPFSQADDSVTRKFGGTGLGLMIARDLIDAMGGELEVESAPQVGSCFWFWIPLKTAATDGPAAVSTAPGAGDPGAALPALAHLIPGRVLLVDDNRVNQQLAAAMLERLGLAFELADNGTDCLRRLAEADYALVLMDMEMPEMDGVTATRRIRESEAEGRHLPIIAMTANALQEDRERCFAAGMDGYIPKPISLGTLKNELYRLFGQVTPQANPTEAAMTTSDDSPAGNRAAAIELMGDEEIFLEVAAMFVADTPRMLDELGQALTASDWPALTRIAHTLKGLFATFAAKGGETAARQLEASARAGNPEGNCTDLATEVRRQAQRLIDELSAGT